MIYSAGFKLPKIKPPRLDLRNRTKKTPQAPAKPKPPVEQPKDPLRANGLDFISNRINDSKEYTTFGFQTEYDKEKEKPKKPLPKEVYMVFNEADWVFTQATAVASVNVCEDREWQITESTIPYVNANANSWEINYLRSCYHTFKGAMNLKDHIAPEEGGTIYGMIIDAVARRVQVPYSDEYVLYIDTIIATNKHIDWEWADAIRKGTIRYLSVGFNCEFLTCTRCGHIYSIDGTGICPHCAFEPSITYYDEFGRKSITSAMCANVEGIDNTGEFVELSYLSVNPAFTGATKSFTLNPPKGQDVKVLMPGEALEKPAYQALKEWIKLKKA